MEERKKVRQTGRGKEKVRQTDIGRLFTSARSRSTLLALLFLPGLSLNRKQM